MTEFAFTYNGLTFGSGTDIDVLRIDGLSLPGLRTSDIDRPQQGGMFAGQDYLTGRTLTFEFEVVGTPSTREATLEAIAEAFLPQQSTELPLVMELPGQDARRIDARPRKRDMAVDIAWSLGTARIYVQLFATDPRIYSDTLHSESGGLGSTSGGLSLPHTFPHAFGTATSGSVYCTNAGIVDTFPTVTLTGPLSVPKVSNDTSGEFVQVNLTVASGETLVLDCLERTALLNGTASRTGLVQRPESDWFTLAPGSNELRLTASTGSGSMLVEWRDAWL